MGCEGCPYDMHRVLTGRCPHVVFDLDDDDDLYGECPVGGKRYLLAIYIEEDKEGYTYDSDEAYIAFICLINSTPSPDVAF